LQSVLPPADIAAVSMSSSPSSQWACIPFVRDRARPAVGAILCTRLGARPPLRQPHLGIVSGSFRLVSDRWHPNVAGPALVECRLMGPAGPEGAPLSLEPRPRAGGSFGARLRAFRVRAGLSQEALAAGAGVGVATLKALERDQRQRPQMQTLVRLAQARGLDSAGRAAPLG